MISLVTDKNGVTWVCFDEPTSAPALKQRKAPVPTFTFELKIRTGHDGPGEDCWYYDLNDDGADRFIADFTQALAEYAWVDCECIVHHKDEPYHDYVELDDVLPRKRATKRLNAVYQRMQALGLPLRQEPSEQD